MTKWIAQVPPSWTCGMTGRKAETQSRIFFLATRIPQESSGFLCEEWKDSPTHGHYPGQNLQVDYAEGIYVGYRYFDKQKIEPLFPFGYGLSYTKFDYSDLKISPSEVSPGKPVEVSLQVRNSGSRSGQRW